MKTILMITPENKEINRFRKRQMNNFVQLTMPYLAGFIHKNKYRIHLVDEYNQKIPFDKRFDLAAITVNTPNAAHCYEISKKLRNSGAKVVMGGPHVTLLPDEVKKHCDYIIIGETETIWPQFLEDFYNNRAKREYFSEQPPSLKGLPIPRRDLIKKRWFTRGAVFASRGCPYQCSYCNLKQIYHPCFRKRPVDEVITDIRNISRRYFVFWDDNFFGDKQFAKELMLALKPLKKRWAAQVTIDACKDQEILRIARESGCLYFFIGIESFSEESLLSVNKGSNQVNEYKDIINLIHENGISVQAGIIFGFDSDDKSIFNKTRDYCKALGIDGVTVSILTPLPGTPLYHDFKKSNRLISEDWSNYNGKTRVAFKPKKMTIEELYEGYLWFRKDFYSMKSIINRLMVSRTNFLHNLIINLGYKWSL